MDRKKEPYERLIQGVIKENEKKMSGVIYDNIKSIPRPMEHKTVSDGRIMFNKTNNTPIPVPNTSTNKLSGNPFVQKSTEGMQKIEKIQKVKMILINDRQISIKPSNKIISSALAKATGSVYNLKDNSWVFPIDYYSILCQALQKGKVVFDKIPQGTLTLARQPVLTEEFLLEGEIYSKMLKFQLDAVNFGLNRNGRVLLADDMGLGKTIQALGIAYFYRNEFPMLIIAPASLLTVWEESIQRFLGMESAIIKQPTDFGSKISIISYTQATSFVDVIKRNNYNVIVCDECHYMKHGTSKRTKTLIPVLQQTSRLIMISGTPAESRPLELYPILMALNKTLYPSFQIYGNRYCGGHKSGAFYDYSGCTNASELAIVLEKGLMVRRMKNIVLNELPKKFRRQVFIDVGDQNLISEKFTKSDLSLEEPSILQEFSKAAGFKLGATIKYLESLMEKNVKATVFAHHQIMIDGIEEFCKTKKVGYIRIDGTTTLAKRQLAVNSFQNQSDIRLAILSIKTCATGLTLTSANTAVFAELYWNPGTLLQAEDRIHRIGQLSDVEIIYLLGKKTVDEQVWPHVLKKLNVLESLGIGNKDFDYSLEASSGTKSTQKKIDDYFRY